MGMFDYVDYECECPKCGAKVKRFQSKDGPCNLKTLQPVDVDSFYSSCDKCYTWIVFETVITRSLQKVVMVKPDEEADHDMPQV